MPDSGEELVTVAEASTRLGVSESQVHNLCKATQLTKMPPPTGRQNHLPHAAVITRASLEELLRTRSAGGHPPHAASTQPHSELPDRDRASNRSAGAVQLLKVQLDQARAELRNERRRTDRLATLLAHTATELRSALASREPLDEIADAYSAALTELLIDDNPGNIG